jgi:hypothetical protein
MPAAQPPKPSARCPAFRQLEPHPHPHPDVEPALRRGCGVVSAGGGTGWGSLVGGVEHGGAVRTNRVSGSEVDGGETEPLTRPGHRRDGHRRAHVVALGAGEPFGAFGYGAAVFGEAASNFVDCGPEWE